MHASGQANLHWFVVTGHRLAVDEQLEGRGPLNAQPVVAPGGRI